MSVRKWIWNPRNQRGWFKATTEQKTEVKLISKETVFWPIKIFLILQAISGYHWSCRYGQKLWGSSTSGRRRQWHPTPVLLPGKSHGWRSLVGCSPWGREESDRTEHLHFHFSLSGLGEGNASPLQCSCLENPRDGGAWWAAVYGVAQCWTQLKRLSRSSSKF